MSWKYPLSMLLLRSRVIRKRGYPFAIYSSLKVLPSHTKDTKRHFSKDSTNDGIIKEGLNTTTNSTTTTQNSFENEFYKATLIDGGAESYNNWASRYDQDATNAGWIGPQAICDLWMRYHKLHLLQQSDVPHKVLDIGCGTGFVAEHMTTLLSNSRHRVHIHGGDLSTDMLEKAKTKGLYTDLKVVNVKEALPYNEGYFDSIISAGLFLPGHCGPDSLCNIIPVLKRGGYFMATIRMASYEDTKTDWNDLIKECQCELIEDNEIEYYTNEEYKGIGLVLLKS